MPQIHEIPQWLADSHPTRLLSVRDGQASRSRGTTRKVDGDNSKWLAAQASAATGDMTLAETELALQYARLKYLQAEAADPDGQASFNNLFYMEAVKTELASRYTAELATIEQTPAAEMSTRVVFPPSLAAATDADLRRALGEQARLSRLLGPEHGVYQDITYSQNVLDVQAEILCRMESALAATEASASGQQSAADTAVSIAK